MEYLNIIRNLRRVLLTAFIINVAIVSVCWGFVWLNLMEHFMWAMPGFTIEMANDYIMWLVGVLHMISIAAFLIPTVALSLEIYCEKKRIIREEIEFEAFKAQLFGEDSEFCGCGCDAVPVKTTKPKAKKSTAKKPAAKKKK
ncbi:MAG: hypothetical protein FWF34_03170 [Alphaproteobacteria bacterium]|nr:hypothetical protein [Alphaproteobacteria bacterium]MCL2890232.1 hypothetical protein [Alphaproteobacteria bacterium]